MLTFLSSSEIMNCLSATFVLHRQYRNDPPKFYKIRNWKSSPPLKDSRCTASTKNLLEHVQVWGDALARKGRIFRGRERLWSLRPQRSGSPCTCPFPRLPLRPRQFLKCLRIYIYGKISKIIDKKIIELTQMKWNFI